MNLVEQLRERRRAIEAEVATLAPVRPPRIVCVTKTHPVETVRAAVEAGNRELGENYASELAEKAAALRDLDVRWHFIGHLQRRQIKQVSGAASVVETLSRVVEAERLAALGFGGEVFVQVAPPDAPATRSGVPREGAPELVAAARSLGLRVVGVMGVALPGEEAPVRAFFRSLVALADELELPERSFGMSADWRWATTEGATILRLGTALLGPRPGSRANLSASEGVEVP